MPLLRAIRRSDVPTDRPLLLLDVDGCVNVFDRERPSFFRNRYFEIDATGIVRFCGMGLGGHEPPGLRKTTWVQYSSELIGKIAETVDAGLCSVAWLTTWNEHAGVLEEVLWPRRRHLSLGYVAWPMETATSAIDGKLRGVADLFADEQTERPIPPLILVDDHAPRVGDDCSLSAMVPRSPATLTIRPHGGRGISRAEWVRVVSFCQTACAK